MADWRNGTSHVTGDVTGARLIIRTSDSFDSARVENDRKIDLIEFILIPSSISNSLIMLD